MLSLVTGATGFLGSHLTRLLAARGEKVRVLVRASSDRRRLAGIGAAVDYAEGDVTDRAAIDRAMTGVERVFHCAAMYVIGTRNAERMRAVNVAGTENVLGAAIEHGALAVHVSSTAALGPSPPGVVADETRWAGDEPRSAYEATKRAAHERARVLGSKPGARVRIAMPVTIYGPDDPSLVGRAHALLVRGLMPIAALATVRLTLVHVDDCAAGLALVAERGSDRGEYVLGGDVTTFRGWFDAAARAAGRAPPRVWLPDAVVGVAGRAGKLAPPLVREGIAMGLGVDWAYSGEKARRELGWEPRGLEQGLRETMAWYRKR
jgi:dihydroflavonol-4-reductase